MAARTRPKPIEPTRMIRVDGEVREYIVKRAKWGESINRTLRRMFKLAQNGGSPKKGAKP